MKSGDAILNNYDNQQYNNQYNDGFEQQSGSGFRRDANQQGAKYSNNPSNGPRFSPIDQQMRTPSNANPFAQNGAVPTAAGRQPMRQGGQNPQATNPQQPSAQPPRQQPNAQRQYQVGQPPRQGRPPISQQPQRPGQQVGRTPAPRQGEMPPQAGRPSPYGTNGANGPRRPVPPKGAPSQTAELLPRDHTGRIKTFSNYNRQGIENVSYNYNFGNGANVVKKKKGGVPKGVIIGVVAAVLVAAFIGVGYLMRPTITLNGTADDILSYGAQYEEQGATGTFLGNDISEDILISGSVDNTMMGKQVVTYTYKLPIIPIPFSITRSVTVEDYELPVISLVASDTVMLPLGSDYKEPGYTAHDNFDGDLTSTVTVEGTVDTATVGVYTITYKTSDSNGNTGIAERRVTVTEDSPLTASVAEFSLDGFFTDAILPETEDAGEQYINDTTFFGDSVIENLALMDGQVPFDKMWCQAGISALDAEDSTLRVNDEETSSTIIDLLTTYKPERVLMSLGTNVVSYVEAQEYIESYETLIENMRTASPDTDFIIMSLTPVMKEYDDGEAGTNSTTNAKINIYNYYIAEMCSRLGVSFLNVAPELKDTDGTAMVGLIRDYEFDGIHPRVAGNDVILEYYTTHAVLN